jgi:diaminohydroxyphosphoribosylaminopyrimidine deaminase/5-amino-6-(5-phosphoribosylamino)uracil reductase
MGEGHKAVLYGRWVFSRRPYIWRNMISNAPDEKYMRRALSLAGKGKGMVHPNPMVGAVVVKDGSIAGEGFHRGPYTPHAEVIAMEKAAGRAMGADLYVTLEPCNHQGRTPPCTEAIIKAGINRLVIAATDPNPSVTGGGIERLKSVGIEVETGVLEEKARKLNAAYEKFVLTGTPLVTLKVATTADGKVAARGGASRWITGEEARKAAHRLRRECDAVMVGRGTVAEDDPELTVRMVPFRGARAPLRVIVDSKLSINLNSKLAAGGEPGVIVATTADHDADKAEVLRGRGVEVLVFNERGGRVDLDELLRRLGRMGIAHLLVEGGPTLIASFLEQGLADNLALFIAPKVFGDEESRSWVEGRVVNDPAQALPLRWLKIHRVGEDLMLEAEIGKRG